MKQEPRDFSRGGFRFLGLRDTTLMRKVIVSRDRFDKLVVLCYNVIVGS